MLMQGPPARITERAWCARRHRDTRRISRNLLPRLGLARETRNEGNKMITKRVALVSAGAA
jgi:hypothetical protein